MLTLKLYFDATYKLLELGLPEYVMLCEDSNGLSEAIAVCFLVCEDTESMHWMVKSFKKCNPEFERTRVVMADKDIRERDILKEALPNISILICMLDASTCDEIKANHYLSINISTILSMSFRDFPFLAPKAILDRSFKSTTWPVS